MHTPLCGHAFGSPEEYVDTAIRKGVSLVTFTCHIPMTGAGYSQEGIRMRFQDIPEYRRMISDAATYGKENGIEVLYGIEAEITPERSEMDSMRALIEEEDFDFVLGSLHHMMPFWRQLMHSQNIHSDADMIRFYFENIAAGAQSGLFHSIAHPDVIRLYSTLEGDFVPADHEAVIKDCLDSVAESGTCLEINTSGLIKGDFVVHPDPIIMAWAIERKIAFTIGSDSHSPDRVGENFEQVIEEFQELGLRELNYFKAGKRLSVAL